MFSYSAIILCTNKMIIQISNIKIWANDYDIKKEVDANEMPYYVHILYVI